MVWNPIQSIINHKKTLSLLAAGAILGGISSGIISYDCGIRSAEPKTAQIRISGYEKFPSLIVSDREGREIPLFGISSELYFSGEERNKMVEKDLHKKRNYVPKY